MAKLTEDERLFRKIEDKIKRAIFDYGLINDGDRILVGLSGGKIPWPWWIYWGAGRKSIVLGLRSW